MLETIPKVLALVSLFIALPWLILHYVTRWKTAATLTGSDERLMEELYDLARRLESRVGTVERIITADTPDWRAIAVDPAAAAQETETQTLRRIK
jgi:phage shock protein B